MLRMKQRGGGWASPVRAAITIVEVVLSVSAIAILMALTLMAVQAARESARRSQCQNNVRQLGLAGQNHIDTVGFFPSGGWGYSWLGVAEFGYGPSQPGGWCFSVLPFVEADNIFRIVATAEIAKTQPETVQQLINALPPVFSCPSRPQRTALNDGILYYGLHSFALGRQTDYAVNAGSRFFPSTPGPGSFADASIYRYPPAVDINGVCWFRSQLRPKAVTDGLSNTLFVGEKWISPTDPGKEANQPAYVGDSYDVRRFTLQPPRPDRVTTEGSLLAFGSGHEAGVNFGFCDGSTRFISYRIDELVYADLGDRRDGRVVPSE
ncbi:MAG: DUF1559 domain-containing protein [bacterium]|nr:DUF1559 domain-containing protein [bacterium]